MSAEHILVVEDAHLMQTLLRAKLHAEGYTVATATKVPEALQAIRTNMPALVVLDLTLAGEDPFDVTDGFLVLSMLRQAYPDSDTAVIIYSVNSSSEAQARAKSMGATALINKKSGVNALLEAVRNALAERRNKKNPPLIVLPSQPLISDRTE